MENQLSHAGEREVSSSEVPSRIVYGGERGAWGRRVRVLESKPQFRTRTAHTHCHRSIPQPDGSTARESIVNEIRRLNCLLMPLAQVALTKPDLI